MKVQVEVGRSFRTREVLDVRDADRKTANQVQRALRPIVASQTPKGTGTLAEKLTPRQEERLGSVAVVIGGDPRERHSRYASVGALVRWVTGGTANAGQGRIYPRRARALRTPWGPKASVRGQQPNDFLTRIVELARPRIHAIFRQGERDRANKLPPRWPKGDPFGRGGRFRRP